MGQTSRPSLAPLKQLNWNNHTGYFQSVPALFLIIFGIKLSEIEKKTKKYVRSAFSTILA